MEHSGQRDFVKLKRLPEMLLSEDGDEHFRNYFPGGIEEANALLADAQRGLDAVRAICATIPTRGK